MTDRRPAPGGPVDGSPGGASDGPARNPENGAADPSSGRSGAARRQAFVLGAGGVVGFAWLLGALSAVAEVTGAEVGDSEVVIGTSAGSVAAALLSCGLPLSVICRHHQAMPAPEDPLIDYDYASTGKAYPPLPGVRPASPRLVLSQLRRPRLVSPMLAASGLLPSGRGSLAPVAQLVHTIAAETGHHARWPGRPQPWIVAADYAQGRRIAFGRTPPPGRDGQPRKAREATLAAAVTASCSIPAWYPPAVIDGVPYVDGGTLSNTSADLLVDAEVDEVFVLAPMASVSPDRPRGPAAKAERWARRLVTRSVLADVQRLRAAGKQVRLLTPGPVDLAVMGVNLMNPRRRMAVLETAQRTTAEALERQLAPRAAAAGAASGRTAAARTAAGSGR